MFPLLHATLRPAQRERTLLTLVYHPNNVFVRLALSPGISQHKPGITIVTVGTLTGKNGVTIVHAVVGNNGILQRTNALVEHAMVKEWRDMERVVSVAQGMRES